MDRYCEKKRMKFLKEEAEIKAQIRASVCRSWRFCVWKHTDEVILLIGGDDECI